MKKVGTERKGVVKKATKENIKNYSRLIIYCLIVILCFILYGNSISNDYALDDSTVITENKFTQQGLNGLKDIFAFDSFAGYNENILNQLSGGRYRPLSIASFAIEFEFFGKNPHISHFINILLYSCVCILLFILLSRYPWDVNRRKWFYSLPFIAVLIFAAHPVHTEVVANIKSRDEIFSLLFSMLSILFFLKYLDFTRTKDIVISSAFYFLGLLSKENATITIIIIPMIIYFFRPVDLRRIIKPLVLLVFVLSVFLILRQVIISGTQTSVLFAQDIMNYSFAEMNLSQKYATITYIFGLYLKLLVFPHPLTWDYYPYHIPKMQWSQIVVILSFIINAFLVFIAIKGFRKRSLFSFCILFYFLSMALISNVLFPVGAFMSERFLFVGSIAFSIISGYLLLNLKVLRAGRFQVNPYLIIIPLLFLYSIKIITRNKAWKDNKTLISTDIRVSENSFKSNAFLGDILYQKADSLDDPLERNSMYEKALMHCEKANNIYPHMKTVNFDLGTIYGKYKNDIGKSIFYLEKAMKLDPDDINVANNLGIAYGIAKKYDKAIETFEKALKLSPNDLNIMGNLVSAYQMTGNSGKALEYSTKIKDFQENNLKN